MMSLEYEKAKPKYSSSLFEGRDLAELDFQLHQRQLATPAKQMAAGSMVNALQQSLLSNDVETINWALSNTDEKVIVNTVRDLGKQSIQALVQNIFIKFQQGIEKAPLLWFSALLKY